MTDTPYLIFGADGQVGTALYQQLGATARPVFPKDADFTNPDALQDFLDNLKETPAAIINAAAYTAVDKAEEEEALAELINATAPGIIARWCATKHIPFVHYSTDYVFSGEGEAPWKEDDATSPLNAYGRGKRNGEEAVQQAGGSYLIFRTSWVYDAVRKNFLTTMLRLGAEREQLSIVNDQWGAPTYAPDLASATLTALFNATHSEPFPSGIYHLCGGSVTSWHGFASEIFRLASKQRKALMLKELSGIPTRAYPTPAKRPLNSRMDCSRAEAILGVRLPAWKESLERCFEEMVSNEERQRA